ncbi:MAG: 2-oxoglutarate dehydrogenase E1 component [Gammaproteobacteria bacterium RIFCSPHIGHO2_12_FULL_35_23]|nr:MAG: 2-oxoglutarate dehydrogenase E1 component [Gammaproteobacteria bacterium RIFCSPHIGHO2_12_FULL_35_23]
MQINDMLSYWKSSYLEGDNLTYIEELYEKYLKNPDSVPLQWQAYFDEINDHKFSKDVSLNEIRDYFKNLIIKPQSFVSTPGQEGKESKVAELINAYRAYGHHHADLDPLKLANRLEMPTLRLEYHGLSEADLTTKFYAGNMIGYPNSTLQEILEILQKTYCETIAVEYMHITSEEEVTWLQQKMEPVANHPNYEKEEKIMLLEQLTAAEELEKFLGTKYVGQKRFSLEGGEGLISLLEVMIKYSAKQELVEEIVIGMAHRGRLNVLINLIGKSPSQLFAEFEGKLIDEQRTGDVKYHKGFSADVVINGKTVHLALAFNPSHLEIVSPVVEGSVRARQRRRGDERREQVLPILIHGDAAVAGQGVVMETLNLSQARGFYTGGSIHIVINNQVGFTTSNPLDARSTLYCTDVIKMVQAPIFHVNGDDPEALAFVAKIVSQYRAKFHKDVAIDLVCYRRHGHNEADDPSITQPEMYTTIKSLPTTKELYAAKLIKEGLITQEQANEIANEYRKKLEAGEPIVKIAGTECNGGRHAPDWSKHIGKELSEEVETKVSAEKLKVLAEKIETIPKEFTVHPQVEKLLTERRKMTQGQLPINWGYAETLAYASLLEEGYPVRLCGQDSGRGTFAHRHVVLHDAKTDENYVPLAHIDAKQAPFLVIDSILSEAAVLAFEYGYASADPESLVIWEAQFGDFANNAQVVIDQFISSGEQKWNRLCGLTMLLPHGYEGMGPEHSSARLERFLQLCAQQNMQVCVPTTPAQVFHMLRRQMIRPARKPLIVMSPKSLLRHKLATSSLEDLTQGKFYLVIPEIDDIKASDTKRVVICSGKVYFDLLQTRRDKQLTDIAIIRIEQQYPFPREELTTLLNKYTKAHDIIWCQEEPKNQGAWYQINHHLHACLAKHQHLNYAGRMASAAPAVGYSTRHNLEQKVLIAEALGL